MPIRIDRASTTEPVLDQFGYLRVDATIGKVGVVKYLRADGTYRKEFRPPEELFSSESLASFSGLPVVEDHPIGSLITPANAAKLQKGGAGTPFREADEVRNKLVVHDLGTVQRIIDGKRQISCGYVCDLDWTSGEYHGEKYDAIQRNIRGNHIAIVDRGRAGEDVKIHMDSSAMGADDVAIEAIEVQMTLEEALKALAEAKAKADVAETRAKAAEGKLEETRARADAAEMMAKATKPTVTVGILRKALHYLPNDTRIDSAKSDRALIELVATEKFKKDLSKQSDEYVLAWADLAFNTETNLNSTVRVDSERVQVKEKAKKKKVRVDARDRFEAAFRAIGAEKENS